MTGPVIPTQCGLAARWQRLAVGNTERQRYLPSEAINSLKGKSETGINAAGMIHFR